MSRRYPLSALGAEASNLSRLSRRTGIQRGTLIRWRREGVPEGRIEDVAMAVGRLPVEVWPDSLRPLQQMHPDCHSYATAVRHKRNGEIPPGKTLADVCEVCALALSEYESRRWKNRMADPEWADRERARNRERMRRRRAALRVEGNQT